MALPSVKTTDFNKKSWSHLYKELKGFGGASIDEEKQLALNKVFQPFLDPENELFCGTVVDVHYDTKKSYKNVLSKLAFLGAFPIKYVAGKKELTKDLNAVLRQPNQEFVIFSQRGNDMTLTWSGQAYPEMLPTVTLMCRKGLNLSMTQENDTDVPYITNVQVSPLIHDKTSSNPNENILAFLDHIPRLVADYLVANYEVRTFQWKEWDTSKDHFGVLVDLYQSTIKMTNESSIELAENLEKAYNGASNPFADAALRARKAAAPTVVVTPPSPVDAEGVDMASRIPLPPSPVDAQVPTVVVTPPTPVDAEGVDMASRIPLPPSPIDTQTPDSAVMSFFHTAAKNITVPATPAVPRETSNKTVSEQVNKVACNYKLFDVLTRQLDLIYDIGVVQDYETKLADKRYELAVALKEDAVRIEKFNTQLAGILNAHERATLVALRGPLVKDVHERYELYKQVKEKHAKYSQYRVDMEKDLDVTSKQVEEALECTAKAAIASASDVDKKSVLTALTAVVAEFKEAHITKQHINDTVKTLYYNYNTHKQSHLDGVREVLYNEPHALCRVSIPGAKKRVDVEVALVDNTYTPKRRSSKKRSSSRKRKGRKRSSSRKRKHSFSHF